MFTRRIKIPAVWNKVSIPFILFLCGFILAANENPNKIDPHGKAVIASGPQTEKDSKDVNPSGSSPNSSAVWLVAFELGHSSVKQTNHKHDKSTGIARLCYLKQEFNFTDSKNTLGQVNSKLANLFTLLGERPSGTS